MSANATPAHTNNPLKQVEHHREYYIPGGDLHLLVDNVLFRIHAYFFERDSVRFKTMLSAPVAPNQTRPGSSDSKPIIIRNCSPSEFARFLWVIYNNTYSDYSSVTAVEWTLILKTACEYEFIEMQHCAIRGLQTCDLNTVERLYIYELYRADPKHIVPLYIELSMRAKAPTDEEVERLGSTKTSLLIFRLREHLRSHSGTGGSSPLPVGVDRDDALHAVCMFLGVDPSQIQTPGARGRPSRTRRLARDSSTVHQVRGTSPRGIRDAFIFGNDLYLGGEQRPATFAAEEVDVADKKVPGFFEDREEGVECRSNSGESSFFEMHSTVVFPCDAPHSPHPSDLSQSRASLVYFAASWTLVLFWGIKSIPSNVHIL